MAAAAIMAASNTFSARHPSLSTKRTARRTQTISKKDIDSTPKLVSKLDHHEPPNMDNLIIENVTRESSSAGSSKPTTPKSQRGVEIISNKGAESAGSSQESETTTPLPGLVETAAVATTITRPLQSSTIEPNANLLPSDRYEAKYDFFGSTDIELALKKGDIVSVIEKVDNGWWKGVCGGRVGWFPEAYVQPAPQEAPKMQGVFPRRMEEMMMSGEEVEVSGACTPGCGTSDTDHNHYPASLPLPLFRSSSLLPLPPPLPFFPFLLFSPFLLPSPPPFPPPIEYRAVFPYHSTTQGDLTFTEGDTILVYWAHDNGWWFGAARSEQGWFPGSYVEVNSSNSSFYMYLPSHPAPSYLFYYNVYLLPSNSSFLTFPSPLFSSYLP